MRRFFACIALIVLLAPGTFLRTDIPSRDNSQTISLVPVTLNPLQPLQKKVGALEFVVGWELRSSNDNFGGISSMLVMPGSRIVALSDGGYLFSFGVGPKNANQTPVMRDFIAPLPQNVAIDDDKATRDSESLVRDPVNGRYWVGFEDSNGIARYDPALTRREVFRVPQQMRDWPDNGGPEAMVLLGTGAFLVFAEDAEVSGDQAEDGLTEAFMFRGDPLDPATQAVKFSYRAPKGYNITDATLLPDGRLILLHRRFNVLEGVSARISIADPADIVANSVFEGEVIAAIDPPLSVDNMEAIAVTREGDDIMVWLASDDNFNSIQRSLLMKFKLLLSDIDGKINKAGGFAPSLKSLEDD